MAAGRELRRHFFKVLLGDFSQQLRIPPSFLRHMPPSQRLKVLLENPQGRSWHVEMERNESGMFFVGSGWSGFAKDNDLREFEFLVFGYDGKARFGVQVFGTSGCERGAGMIQLLQEEKRKRGRPKGSLGRRATKLGAPPGRAVEGENKTTGVDDGGGFKGADVHYQKKVSEVAELFTSSRPHFTVYMKRGHVCRPFSLRVPATFARQHLPANKARLLLRDAQEKVWVVTYGSQCGCISGGWAQFSQGNNLKVGDLCTFELIGPVELRVRVLPEGGTTS